MTPLSPDLVALFRHRGASGRYLDVDLPPGRIILSEESDQPMPALWLSDDPAPPGLWARLREAHAQSGLWPLLLGGLDDDPDRPWAEGELAPDEMSWPGLHSAHEVLARMWSEHTEARGFPSPADSAPQASPGSPTDSAPHASLEYLKPFESGWPGGLVPPRHDGDPDAEAESCAADLLAHDPSVRLGLVAADRGADALAVAGWMGPFNYSSDTGKIAAVLRDWEDRFGVRVVRADYATLCLSVAAPPRARDDALLVAAEHFAFCPDNLWQSPGTLADYARDLVGARMWAFWWD